jgi:hypothetical protein
MIAAQSVIRKSRKLFDTIFRRRREPKPPVTQYQYLKDDGSFDYERYRRIQTEGNRQKIHITWAVEPNIAFLANYIQGLMVPTFGICHGTRRGDEQTWFRKHLNCEVIGTEISDTATSFPNTIQWDFHDVKPEWIGGVDFIYSNALDHSYNPEKCLNAWMTCLRPGGVCIIEHSTLHDTSAADELDPFGASIFLMPYLIARWGNGRYFVRQILDAPDTSTVRRFGVKSNVCLNFIVIQNLAR